MNLAQDQVSKANIGKLILSEILYNFGLVWAKYILFFQYLGYNYGDIGLYEAICSIAIIVTELGSGALADFIGRKWAVAIGNISMLLMALLLGLGQGGVTILVLIGIFSGLDFSFRSGATTALLYDSLQQEHREAEFLAISGKIRAFSLISRMVGMVIGSILFNYLPRLPFWIWSVFLILSTITILLVREPPVKTQKVSWVQLNKNMWGNVRFIFRNKLLLWMVGFFLIADMFAEAYWDIFSQAHLELAGLSSEGIGIIFAGITVVNGFASVFIGKIEQKIGEKRLLYLVILIQCTIFLLMAIITKWIWLALLILLFTMNRNFGHLLEENYRNKIIPSDKRAGVLSAASFLKNGLFGGWAIIWLYGIALTQLNYSTVFMITSGILFLLGIAFLLIRKFEK